jgi:hypothetical protein
MGAAIPVMHYTGMAAVTFSISALFVFGWKPCIDRLLRIRADLELGAMMIRVATVGIPAVGRHKLDHLQGAFRAADVRDVDIGFLFLIERRGVHEQAVGKNRRCRRIVNASRDRPLTTVRPRLAYGFRIRWEFAPRIHCEGNSVKARMESHLPNSDVKFVASPDFGNGTGGFSRVRQRSTARGRPLGNVYRRTFRRFNRYSIFL